MRRQPSAGPLIAAFAALLAVSPSALAQAAGPTDEPRTVRVGVHDNRPLVFRGPGGLYQGLAVDVLEEIAGQEGWSQVQVPCAWSACLERLAAGRLDLLLGIAHSEDRERRFRFNETPLVHNWGVIYRRPELRVSSLLDLHGLRLAVMRGTIHAQVLRHELERFDVAATLVEADDYGTVLSLVERDEADAGVVSRLYGLLRADAYAVLATGILFNPIEIRFAAPLRSDGALLESIDRRLRLLKADPGSAYHAAVRRWLSGPQPTSVPPWVYWALGGALAVLTAALLLSLVLRRQVRSRTRDLVAQSRQLQREIAERKVAQERLNRLTFYDELTGLPNRFLFVDRLQQALADADRHGGRVAILLVDIDRFRAVNERFGHAAGDAVLRRLCDRLEKSVTDPDTVSRLRSDELAILLTDVSGAPEVEAQAALTLRTCSDPIDLGDQRVSVTASVGAAVAPEHGEDAETLLRSADAALYVVKRRGRNAYSLYTREFITLARARLTLESELRQAVQRGSVDLHYQPQVSLISGAVVGVEALLRLHDSRRGWLSAEDVVPVAEEIGLIRELGDVVLARACAQMERWRQLGLGPLRLAVNVSSRQLEGGHLVVSIDRALRASGLPSSWLTVELTESLLVDGGPAGVGLLAELRERDIRISVDDFGTGYSSLSYLQRLPIDSLKIDRTFIREIPGAERAERVTSAILGLAANLELEAIAEGIETPEQLDFLRGHGCRFGQGFLLGRPAPASQVEAWLHQPHRMGARTAS